MARITFVAVSVAILVLAGCAKKPAQPVGVTAPDKSVEAPSSAYDDNPEPGAGSTKVSNLATPVPLEAEPEAAPSDNSAYAPTPASRTYTVQRGDTLFSIARKVYGDARRYKDIARANNMSDPNKLRVGQVLELP